MSSINEQLADKIIARAIDLLHLENSLSHEILGYLELLKQDIIKKLGNISPTDILRVSDRQRRLEKLLTQVADTIKTTYKDITKVTDKNLYELITLDSKFTTTVLNSAIGIDITSISWTTEQIKAIMSNTLIQGAPSAEWWLRQAATTIQRFTDQMRIGVLAGESNSQLERRIRGTATGRRITYTINGTTQRLPEYRGGIMDISARHAKALVRTSVQAISSEARMATFAKNPDVVKGYQAQVTLDNRTSKLCMSRSGYAWDLKGKPLNSLTKINFPGPPPWHWNCRTCLTPITYSWNELLERAGKSTKKKLSEMPESTQASMDGQVAGNLTYEEWLKTKPVTFQKEVLGSSRWKLWTEGKISFSDLVTGSGKILTIEQLKNKQ